MASSTVKSEKCSHSKIKENSKYYQLYKNNELKKKVKWEECPFKFMFPNNLIGSLIPTIDETESIIEDHSVHSDARKTEKIAPKSASKISGLSAIVSMIKNNNKSTELNSTNTKSNETVVAQNSFEQNSSETSSTSSEQIVSPKKNVPTIEELRPSMLPGWYYLPYSNTNMTMPIAMPGMPGMPGFSGVPMMSPMPGMTTIPMTPSVSFITVVVFDHSEKPFQQLFVIKVAMSNTESTCRVRISTPNQTENDFVDYEF